MILLELKTSKRLALELQILGKLFACCEARKKKYFFRVSYVSLV